MTTHKAEGNKFFASGDFEKALECYTNAIEEVREKRDVSKADRAVLYNNRAACNLKLGRYDQAAADANHTIELDRYNSKAHVRLARAQAHQGRMDAAVTSMEEAVRIEPNNASFNEELAALRSGNVAPTAATGPGVFSALFGQSDGPAFFLDTAVIFASMLHIVTMLFAPAIGQLLAQIAFGCMGARQIVGMISAKQVPSLSTKIFSELTGSFFGQFAIVCTIFAVFPSAPPHLFMLAMCIYCFTDLVLRFRARLDAIVALSPTIGGIRGFLEGKVAEVQNSRQQTMGTAALCEIMSCIFAPLSGVGWMHMFVLFQFLKWRYVGDAVVKQTWGALHQQITQLTYHQRCPGFVGRAYSSFSYYLHSYATAQ